MLDADMWEPSWPDSHLGIVRSYSAASDKDAAIASGAGQNVASLGAVAGEETRVCPSPRALERLARGGFELDAVPGTTPS
jgi:hypothetical protein